MSDKTGIEWADSTFNPWMGCTKVSPACDHCYAERDTARFGRVQWGAGQPRVRTSAANWKKPLQWNRQGFFACPDCGLRGDAMAMGDDPKVCAHLNAKPARRRVFCASLADVFDNDVDPAWRRDLFDLIELTPNIDWMLLTKRIGNVFRLVADARTHDWLAGRRNVWIGATICNQEEADRDIPKLLAVPAAVRFLSMEPLLGPVDLTRICPKIFDASVDSLRGMWRWTDGPRQKEGGAIDWVIVGGESGPKARPMHPEWVRSLRDQCAAAGVPFLFKQWGEWAPSAANIGHGDGLMARVGKKAAGRLLDGVQHDGYPKGGAA